MTVGQNIKRARSEDQKAERQAVILSAARDMIDETGFDGVTMSALAKRAGLAKGTLYLYVRSKEELFLLLFLEAMRTVVARFKQDVTLGDSAAQIARCMTDHAQTTPLFLPMYARLVAVIESNVADEPLFAAKRQLLALSAEWAAHLAHVTRASPDMVEPLAKALMMSLQGAAQFDLSSQRDPKGLPEDIREAFSRYAFVPSFEPAARLILEAVMSQNSEDQPS
ncbi:TetR/AcrR family transcriptional regulator [Aliiroseovarius sp. S1123]|uniref:TetR/AcrR family transcriptional regulator n=1 Tax=unclassified Aliiroseovarius TaxID=2623558 RepID=UPI001FF0F37B|nr:TetR/AcrR family transcriptional regulator [Aliiroseovarius sp. S1123]MCK0170693.1 TetR/AcrR family transcriptional regulator [Aliiroseovarius sp. S1123]